MKATYLGKKKGDSFKKVSITPKEAKLKLVHTDVRGIDLISSISGRSYFVIFTYDHLGKVWVYLMRQNKKVSHQQLIA